MTAYVEECRKEWKRLGVPDLLADEMAADIEADLAEAQADGVSAAEILGESDPRRFAAVWASERGLVSERAPEEPPKRSRTRFWIVLAVVILLLGLVLGVGAVALLATAKVEVSTSPPVRVTGISPVPAVRVPSLVGLRACHARRIALAAGLTVRGIPAGRCNAIVIAQHPSAGTTVPRRTQAALTLRPSANG